MIFIKALILSGSANKVNDKSFIPNKMGLTFSCVIECSNALKSMGRDVEHICLNKKDLKRCMACGERGWGICSEQHECILNDDFNDLYKYMGKFDFYIFVTPVYFHEMSEVMKSFFDRLKRCDAFYEDSSIKNKKTVCIAAAGGSGSGTEETLKSFDTLNYFLKTSVVARIDVTKFNFEKQKEKIKKAMNSLTK